MALAQIDSSAKIFSNFLIVRYGFKYKLRGQSGDRFRFTTIAALHCQAARAEDTDWAQIVRLYDVMERLHPSPIVSLNRALRSRW